MSLFDEEKDVMHRADLKISPDFFLSSHWLYSYSFLLIGRCDYFGLVLRHSIKKRSITGMVSDHTALY